MFSIKFWNDRVKNFTIFDIKLLQGGTICFGIILAKLFPQIFNIDIGWFILVAVLFLIRPCYAMFLKR